MHAIRDYGAEIELLLAFRIENRGHSPHSWVRPASHPLYGSLPTKIERQARENGQSSHHCALETDTGKEKRTDGAQSIMAVAPGLHGHMATRAQGVHRIAIDTTT